MFSFSAGLWTLEFEELQDFLCGVESEKALCPTLSVGPDLLGAGIGTRENFGKK
jgi:hypothetical protein